MFAPYLDIYRGAIALQARGAWYEAFIAPGFVSLVHYWKPNDHYGIWPEEHLLHTGDGVDGELNGKSMGSIYDPSFVVIGRPLDQWEERLCWRVRVGRVAIIPNCCHLLVDDLRAVWTDEDDLVESLTERARTYPDHPEYMPPPSGPNLIRFPIERRRAS